MITGRISAETVAKYQPTKLAVMEGNFPANEPAGMYLFGYLDEKSQQVYGLKIPGLLSFLVNGDTNKPVAGIKSFKKEDLPPMNIVFQTYHFMITIGVLLFVITSVCLIYLWKGKLFETTWLLKILVPAVLLPQFANQLGWMTAEIGRQPWIVYGLLRTSQGLSKAVTANLVLTSLIMFTLIYLLLFVLYIYLFDSKIKHGPDDAGYDTHGHRAD
jgi:cytochrome d ubiquinol oxidase subunit I